MKSNRLALFGLVIVLVAMAVVFGLVNRIPTTSLTSVTAVPNDFSSAAAYGPNTIVLSNGRAFVSYNYATRETKLLSPDETTEGLDNLDRLYVSADKNYLVFHVSLASAGGPLDAKLRSAGLDPTEPSWWVYNVSTQSFSFFPQDVSSVRLAGTDAYGLVNTASTTSINTYSLDGLQLLGSVAVPNCTDFYPASGGFLLTTENSQVLYTTNGVVNDVVLSSANPLNVTPDGGSAISTVGTKAGTELVSFDVQKRTTTVLAKNVGTNFGWTAANDVLFNKASGGSTKPEPLYIYNSSTMKVTKLNIANSSQFQTATTPVALFDNHTALFTNASGTTYLAGTAVQALASVPTDYDKTILVGGNPVEIQYDAAEQAFLVTLLSSAAQAEQQAVYQQLGSDGYIPVLLNIRFSVLRPIGGAN